MVDILLFLYRVVAYVMYLGGQQVQREDEYQLQISTFILKIAWPSLIFGKFTIPLPEIADLLRLMFYILAERCRRVVSLRNFVHILSAYPRSFTQTSE